MTHSQSSKNYMAFSIFYVTSSILWPRTR